MERRLLDYAVLDAKTALRALAVVAGAVAISPAFWVILALYTGNYWLGLPAFIMIVALSIVGVIKTILDL